MSNFIQKVDVAGLSADSLIEAALIRNGANSEILKIAPIRDELINYLKAVQIRKSKFRTIVTKGDLLQNIDKVISQRLEIKPDSIRMLGNNYSETLGNEVNQETTQKTSFKRTPNGVKKVVDRVTKVFDNNMPEVSSPTNYMQRDTTEVIFGTSGEIDRVLNRVLITRENVNIATKMNRSFEGVKLCDKKAIRISRGPRKEFASVELMQEVRTLGIQQEKTIKLKNPSYRLKGDELTDLVDSKQAERILFSSLNVDDLSAENLKKVLPKDNTVTDYEQLEEEINKLDENRKKIAFRMFGTRIPNNPEVEEGIGENG